MTVQKLPVFAPEPHYKYSIGLDGVTYVLQFDWNARDGLWYLNIYDASEGLLKAGVPLLIGNDLLGRFVDLNLPIGSLEVVDATGLDLDPGLNDFGQRVQLIYTPFADLPAGYAVLV